MSSHSPWQGGQAPGSGEDRCLLVWLTIITDKKPNSTEKKKFYFFSFKKISKWTPLIKTILFFFFLKNKALLHNMCLKIIKKKNEESWAWN